nr:hypothetical protein Iba_chr01dCG16470 [Ipomoea batatas]
MEETSDFIPAANVLLLVSTMADKTIVITDRHIPIPIFWRRHCEDYEGCRWDLEGGAAETPVGLDGLEDYKVLSLDDGDVVDDSGSPYWEDSQDNSDINLSSHKKHRTRQEHEDVLGSNWSAPNAKLHGLIPEAPITSRPKPHSKNAICPAVGALHSVADEPLQGSG